MLLSYILVLTIVGAYADSYGSYGAQQQFQSTPMATPQMNPCTEEVMRSTEIQLFADPEDLASYLICTDVGIFISMPCSPGTQFNVQHRHCLPLGYNAPVCPEGSCMNNADCDLDEMGQPMCMCRVGFTGERCEVDVNECETLGGNEQCSVNNGRCVDQVNAYYCEWSNGAEVGMHFETRMFMPCTLENIEMGKQFFDLQSEGGNVYLQCTSEHTFTVRRCAEMLFWHQELRTCSIERPLTKTGVCQTFPCQNDGVCEDMGASNFVCQCKPGYTGAFCETEMDMCLSQPCQNGGRCVSSNGGYNCVCQDNLVDKSCATNVRNPCTVDTGVITYFANPSDRTSYIQCSLGFGFVKNCAPGLVWDDSTYGCVYQFVPQAPRHTSYGYGAKNQYAEETTAVPTFVEPTQPTYGAPEYQQETTERPTFVEPTQPSYHQETTARPTFVEPTQPSYHQETTARPTFVEPTQPTYSKQVPQSFARPTLPQKQSYGGQEVPQSFARPTLPQMPTMRPTQSSYNQEMTTEAPRFVEPTQPSYNQEMTTETPRFVEPTQPSYGNQVPQSFARPSLPQMPTMRPTMPQMPTMRPTMPQQPTMRPTMPQQPTMRPTMPSMMPRESTMMPEVPTMRPHDLEMRPKFSNFVPSNEGPSRFGERTLKAMRQLKSKQ